MLKHRKNVWNWSACINCRFYYYPCCATRSPRRNQVNRCVTMNACMNVNGGPWRTGQTDQLCISFSIPSSIDLMKRLVESGEWSRLIDRKTCSKIERHEWNYYVIMELHHLLRPKSTTIKPNNVPSGFKQRHQTRYTKGNRTFMESQDRGLRIGELTTPDWFIGWIGRDETFGCWEALLRWSSFSYNQ